MDIDLSDIEEFQCELVNPELEQVYIKRPLLLLLLVFFKIQFELFLEIN
jgi:hypothetical protein